MNYSRMVAKLLGVGFILATTQYSFATAPAASAETDIPYDALRHFTEVFSLIKNDYVEPVEDEFLIDNAIKGMLLGLDPHSAYLSKEDFEDLQVNTRGEFGGLGIEVGMEDGFIKVITPIDDTPASEAGVEAGDMIIRLDDVPVKGLGLADAVARMRGEPGSTIVLTILREGEDQPLTIEITRAIIKVKSVKSRMLEANYGYVRITQFQASTGRNMRLAIEKLVEKNGAPLSGIVLDLRNNPGGVLSAAVDVSDAFLKDGLVVYTEGRVQSNSSKFESKPDDILNEAPIVVLVNEGSASASEIVAGALQDHKRALIMGRPTFGKGSVQSILPIDSETGLKLTTARYYTPNGRSIQAQGIVPDIVLDNLQISELKNQEKFIPVKEADLSGHLENDEGEGADGENAKGKVDSLASKDYPVFQALSLLKGIVLWGPKQ